MPSNKCIGSSPELPTIEKTTVALVGRTVMCTVHRLAIAAEQPARASGAKVRCWYAPAPDCMVASAEAIEGLAAVDDT